MSNNKRATLTSINSCTLKEPVKPTKKKLVRLNLALSEPNKEWCPVFNYENLIKAAQEKKESEQSEMGSTKNLNGSALSFSDEDEKGLKRIARQFEEKYGGNGKRKRCQTYTELGAGYDENDSFIDNTEACEEGLVDEVEKKHDGYYINCERFDKEVVSDQSDFEEVRPKAKRVKRVAELTDEDSIGTVVEDPAKKPKPAVEHRDTTNDDLEQKKFKKQLDIESKKKPKTVKILLEEKRTNETSQKFEPNAPPPPAPPPPPPPPPPPLPICDTKKVTSSDDHKSVTEIIESVINAVNIKDESTQDSVFSSHSGISSSESEENQGLKIQQPETPASLPEGLSLELKGIISGLKEAAIKSTETKRKFFSAEVNALMLKLELSCRAQLSPAQRHNVYSHLAFFLPCSKATLVARGKKLVMDEGDSELKSTMSKVKEIINSTMLRLQEAYAQRCLKTSLKSNEKYSTGFGPEEEKPKGHNVHLPRKTFTWNDALKNHLKTIIRIKVRQYNITHIKGQGLEFYMNDFLSKNLLPFWPKGWMKISSLYKQCSDTLQEEAKVFKIPCSNGPNNKSIKNIPIDVPPGNVAESSKKKMKVLEKFPDPVRSSDCHFPYSVNEVKNEQTERFGSFEVACENQSDSSRLIRYNHSKVPSKKKKCQGDKIKSDLIQSETVKNLGTSEPSEKMSTSSSVIQCPKTEVTVPFPQKVTNKVGPISLKHRILKDSAKENEQEKSLFNKNNLECSVSWSNGLDKPDTRLDIFNEDKKNLTSVRSIKTDCCEVESNTDIDPSMSSDEAERKMHEETTAATDILSQLITDQNSHSQNISVCGADDKVQMQLNEVMQDLVVLNQMSADTVENTIDGNIDPCINLSANHKEETRDVKMGADFQEEFYSHIRKEVQKQSHSGLGDPSSFYNDIPIRDSPTSHFTSQTIPPNINAGSIPLQVHPASKGVIRPRYYQRLQQFSEEDSLSAAIQFGWPVSGPSPQH